MRGQIRNSYFALIIAALCLFAATAARAACSNPAGTAGTMPIYNTSTQQFQYCDGTNWIAMHRPGTGSGGCTGPARPEGRMAYNTTYRVMQGCAGNVWRAMGPIGGGSASSWAQINAGTGHTCAIKADGTLWCWGSDGSGQLGNGATTGDQAGPVQESTGATDWAQVSAADSHSCAVKTDGTLWCWGWDGYGALGNGAAGSQSSPDQEATLSTNWAQVSAGGIGTNGIFSCAVKADGTLWCWGSDNVGQLGNGATTGNQDTPVQEVTTATDWAQVSTGSSHNCAIKTDGTLWCWGSDGNGQLGNGATTGNQDTPVQESTVATDWAEVTAGRLQTCARKTNNTVWCWGYGSFGALGTGNSTTQTSPTQEATAATDWVEVSTGRGGNGLGDHTCARKANGTLWCWGQDGSGQLGDGGTNTTQYSPVQEATLTSDWGQISVGDAHTCALKADGTFRCWGSDINGRLGNGSTTTGNQDIPTQISIAATDWAQIDAGSSFTCAAKTGGTLWCWGRDNSGELGNGAVTGNQIIPQQESTAASNWGQFSAGGIHGCAIKAGGTLWCWGDDTYGQQGNGAGQTGQNSPGQEVTAATDWTQFSAGGIHGCAIKTDNTLWCWGRDADGQLGNGAVAGNQHNPSQESTAATDWAQVSAANSHTCAIKTDNTLWCWGADDNGRLGNGATTGDQIDPVQESTAATDWAQVSAGNAHTCAVKTDNTLWCWGGDLYGELGNGAVSGDQVSPVQESTAATDWAQVSASDNRATCAVKTGGTLWCWGQNVFGKLGIGGSTSQISPTQEATAATDWQAVSTGTEHACAIKTGGTVWCWGSNQYGQLAVGTYLGDAPFVNSLCLNPERWGGTLLYNSSSDVMQYCDGVGWVGIGK